MNYRRNEDKWPQRTGMNYNLVHSVEDISDESGTVSEPVTLAEMKDYLRLEGFSGESSGLSMQEPLQLTLEAGNVVQSDDLIGSDRRITSVEREGLGYSKTTGTPGERQYVYDSVAGTITFAEDGAGLTIDINYGLTGGSNDSGDFDFDDVLIESMITAARERIEIHTDCSLIPKRIQAVITNLCGGITLPAGPVTGDVTAVDSEGAAIAAEDIKLIGTKFPDLDTPLSEKMVLEYSAGYTTVPKGLKLAIMNEVAFRYENRGDENIDDGICKAARMLAAPYVRGSAYA